MRKAQKREILEFINSLHQAHMEVKEALQQHNYDTVQNMLSECQDFAVALGENIEKLEGEGHITVSHVEAYCETLFQVFKEITDGEVNENRIYKILKRRLLDVENSVKNDISIKKEVAFFPYKASMWDSLESIYLVAKEDPECDAYCVPIPYFDLNLDNSFGKMHYEGGKYPEGIEIIDWEKYNFEDRRPDVIYIHNPYDEYNFVVSVHPRYYSSNLKKYTDTLVYVPYFISSGGMLEGQSLLSAYGNADYIVIQSPQFRKYFDQSIPDEKFLPFGSPKVDRVLNKCKNPPKPSEEWKEKMYDEDGRKKKVIFYNTSLSKMLEDTENFFKKMGYVFKCFAERKDVCLLWRPHPLMETTLDSMRPMFRMTYETLKKKYIESDLGIYDATSDVTDAVALSDAYIGDAGSSITALFGVAGKPMFILDNGIHSKPRKDSWRDKIGMQFNTLEKERFVIVHGNKLYVSEEEKYDYHYFCNLSDNVEDRATYITAYVINGKKYVCPLHAQEILRIGDEGVEKRISLKKEVITGQAFVDAFKYDRFLILQPHYYPAVVCYDTVAEECRYYADHADVFIKDRDGRKMLGGSLLYQGILYIASPVDRLVYRLDIESGRSEVITIPVQNKGGWNMLAEYMGEIWLFPYEENSIVRWNPRTGETKEYREFPKGFACVNPGLNQECKEQLFGSVAFYEDELYLTPRWANMYLRLNIQTERFTKWIPPFEAREGENKVMWNKAVFLENQTEDGRGWIKIYSNINKKLYHVNMKTNEYEEIEIRFDPKELEKHEQGFGECPGTLKYACKESIFNSLDRFIAGTTAGNPYDKEKQLATYGELAANSDGSCGRKIYEYIKLQD